MKRLLGIIFLLIASFLTIGFVRQIVKMFDIMARAFSGSADDFGFLAVTAFSWMMSASIIYVLFHYGLKWTRTKSHPSVRNTNALDEDLIRNEK